MNRRFILFLLCFLFLSSVTGFDLLFGQVVAGSIPAGSVVLNDVVSLEVTESDYDTSGYLDLDQDGLMDLSFLLHKGFPPVDNPHFVKVFLLNNQYALCYRDTVFHHLTLHNAGDTLCENMSLWGTTDHYTLDCFGAWTCSFDTTPTVNKFLAYKNLTTGNEGWIMFSMNLYPTESAPAVTFQINEWLTYNPITSVEDISHQSTVGLYPNPTSDGKITCPVGIVPEQIVAYDMWGRQQTFLQTSQRQFQLPDQPGLYFIRMNDSSGQAILQRILRL